MRALIVALLFATPALAQLAPGTGMYREDTAHSDGHYGVLGLHVRKDVATAICGTDGDYCPLIVDSTGRLWITGAVTVSGSVAVTGTFWQATQPVSGPLTDAQLRATPVPVSGTVTVTDGAGSLNVIVDSSALPSGAATVAAQTTGNASLSSIDGKIVLPAALDGANLKVHEQGTVTVTGTVTTGGLTDTQLRASPVPVSGTVTVTDGSGAINVIVDSSALPSGASTLAEQQTQTTSLQLIDDAVSTTGSAVPAKGLQATGTDGTNARALKTDSSGELQVDVLTMPTVTVSGPLTDTQLRATPVPVSGTVTVTDGSGALNVIVDSSALPSGAATLAEQQTQTTALQLIDDLSLAQGSTTASQRGPLVQGAVTTAAPSYTTAQTSPLSLTTTGGLRHDLTTIAGTAPTTAGKVDVKGADGDVFVRQTSAANLLATVTQAAGTWNNDLIKLNGTTVDTNSGNKSAGTLRVVIATDQPNLTSALNVNCTSGCVAGGSFSDSSAFTFATTAVSNTSFVVDDTATNAVAENSAGAARMSTNRVLFVDLKNTQANTTAIKVDNSAVTQPANVTQLGGTAIDTNSGTKSAGTQRIVLATDQPNLTTPLNVAITPSATAASNSDGSCVSVSTTTTVLASFSTRKTAVLIAQCDPSACNTDTVFVKLAATATTSDFPLAPGDRIILSGASVYTGVIDAIANSGTQKVCVIEW